MKLKVVPVAPIAQKEACQVKKEERYLKAVVDVVKGKEAISANNLEQLPVAKALVTTSCVS